MPHIIFSHQVIHVLGEPVDEMCKWNDHYEQKWISSGVSSLTNYCVSWCVCVRDTFCMLSLLANR